MALNKSNKNSCDINKNVYKVEMCQARAPLQKGVGSCKYLPRVKGQGKLQRTGYAVVKSHIENTLVLILGIYMCDLALTPHEAF